MNKEVEKLAENKAVECFPNGTAGDTHFDYLQELRREGFEEGFIEGYKATINTQKNQELNGWVALFKDEKNYLDFLKWQKEQTNEASKP